MTKTSRDRILVRIAIEVLRISTLKTRKGSSLDFHEVAVWELHRALELAFMMGQCHPAKDRRPQVREVTP